MKKLDDIPIDEFLKVKTVNDFRKVTYSMDEIKLLKDKLILLNDLKGFLDDYNEYISKEYNYVKDSWNWMNSYPEVFLQSDIDSMQEFYDNIISTTELSLLLDSENRRILKGQFQQYKMKYMRTLLCETYKNNWRVRKLG